REIQRAQQSWIAVDVADDFPLVPDMIPGGDDVHARVVKLAADRGRDAEAVCGILTVQDHQIDVELAAEPGQSLADRIPATAADHVTQKKQPHPNPFQPERVTRRAPSSVTTQSSGSSVSPCGTEVTSCAAKPTPAATTGPTARSAASVLS